MAITVKHPFVSTVPDAADTSIVRPSNWNADHTVTGLGTAAELNAGVANGVATLDGSGTVPISQLPAAVLGALSYQGTWNASTNTPTLTSSVGTKGYYYVVNVAGSTNLNGITDWLVGDWAVFNGSVWQKVDNTDAVTSVNGYTGTVVLGYADVGAFPATSTTGSGNVVLATGATQANPTISNYENFTPTTAPSYSEGRVWYDSTEKALAFYNDSSSIAVHVGQDLIVKVINNTGSTIANGSPVYITGTSSGQTYPNVALAKADVAATSAVIGLTNGSIANGAFGYVTSQGTIDNVNTSTFTVGQVLYLSPYSAGQLMNTIPPTGITVQVGVVSYVDASAGHIYVKQTTPLAVPASIITGTLGVANGGTGATTLTGYVKGSGTSAMTASATIPTTDLSGTVTNAQLANSAITINGTSTSLGGSISVGTVTSVTGTSPVASSGGATPAISLSSGYGDTQNPYASKTANYFLAAPNGTTGVPTFRAVVAADIPTLNQNTTGSAAKWTTARTESLTGDVTGSTTVDGSANYSIATTLANTTVTAGSYTLASITVDSKGRITAASNGSGGAGTVTSVAASVPSFLSISGSPITTSGTLAISYSGTALPLANGGTGATSAPAAMTNLRGWTTTATAAGTTTLTNTSTFQQEFTGTNTQTVVMPVTSTLALGWSFEITNNSTGAVTVQSSGLNTIGTVNAGTTASLVCTAITGTTAASWDFDIDGFATETGTGSVVRATSPTLVTPALGTPASGNFSTGTFTWPTFNQNTTGTAAGLSATLVATSGGTGQSSYAVGDLLYASTTTALSKLADVATGNSLISGGVGVAPSWGKIGLTTHVSGTLPIANGGTNGTATPTAGAVPYGTGTAFGFTAAGTAGQVLTSQGAGIPTWTTPTTGTVTSVTGTAPIASSGGATPAISISQATTSTNGYLSSTDWNTFNGKAPSVTYTSTYVPYGQGTTTPALSANFTYDPTLLTLTAPQVSASNGIVCNANTIAANYTIPTNYNAMSAGPITVNTGITVTVPTGSTWVVV